MFTNNETHISHSPSYRCLPEVKLRSYYSRPFKLVTGSFTHQHFSTHLQLISVHSENMSNPLLKCVLICHTSLPEEMHVSPQPPRTHTPMRPTQTSSLAVTNRLGQEPTLYTIPWFVRRSFHHRMNVAWAWLSIQCSKNVGILV